MSPFCDLGTMRKRADRDSGKRISIAPSRVCMRCQCVEVPASTEVKAGLIVRSAQWKREGENALMSCSGVIPSITSAMTSQ